MWLIWKYGIESLLDLCSSDESIKKIIGYLKDKQNDWN